MKKKKVSISHRAHRHPHKNKSFLPLLIIILGLLCVVYAWSRYSGDLRLKAQTSSIKLGKFDPVLLPTGSVQYPNIKNVVGLITGGPVAPNDPYYCIDDVDPEGCDDQTAFHVPKGSGGISGTCGSVIEQGHKIVSSLPQGLKDFRDSVSPAITNCGYDTGSYSSGYVSTFFIIDAFNLAGFHELSKTNPSHIDGAQLLDWWKSSPAQTAGYTFIPYSPSVLSFHASGQKDMTGCVVFLNVAGGVHVGLFNALETVNGNGDGVLSILQSGARYFIDRFEVVGWDVKNTPLHQTALSGVLGFGCH